MASMPTRSFASISGSFQSSAATSATTSASSTAVPARSMRWLMRMSVTISSAIVRAFACSRRRETPVQAKRRFVDWSTTVRWMAIDDNNLAWSVTAKLQITLFGARLTIGAGCAACLRFGARLAPLDQERLAGGHSILCSKQYQFGAARPWANPKASHFVQPGCSQRCPNGPLSVS